MIDTVCYQYIYFFQRRLRREKEKGTAIPVTFAQVDYANIFCPPGHGHAIKMFNNLYLKG